MFLPFNVETNGLVLSIEFNAFSILLEFAIEISISSI